MTAAPAEALLETVPDRALGGAETTTVPPGHVMRYGYVTLEQVTFRDFGGMSVEAFAQWLARFRDLGDTRHQFERCPMGTWVERGGRRIFRVDNGRHRFLAAIFQGYRHVLVRWLEEVE